MMHFGFWMLCPSTTHWGPILLRSKLVVSPLNEPLNLDSGAGTPFDAPRGKTNGPVSRSNAELVIKGICLTLSEIFEKLKENCRNVTATEEAEEEENAKETAKVVQLAKWDQVEVNLPTYESLKALSTLTKQLPNMNKVLESVKNLYMQFFPDEHETLLVQKSVDYRNKASSERIEENSEDTLGDDLAGQVLREIERQSMRDTYVRSIAKEKGPKGLRKP
ncbi:hypothetical protein KFL_004900040 [Klebsormidium nitens]|uniref:Uncharacterized protein n=1 Tax=Klebsormidium nitens TaxID=105231 RepID=A0A1Y1IKD1_KLENI|nr:hypothetical protein KFL_004900040 [Klebsormidium nitens]|eukprot:GAQ89137.1 hypothetical protein KFL_004900040 [Klebsormidium nitens]